MAEPLLIPADAAQRLLAAANGEGRWHEERVTEGWLLAKSKIKYGYIQNCKQMRWCCYLKNYKQKDSQSTAFKLT